MARPEDLTVLVVDDEEDVREFLSDMLEDVGFRVRTAADGAEALASVKEEVPDFISLDLVMPNKSGIRFLYDLRHNPKWAKIPFVIVTAHAHDDLGGKDLEDILGNKSMSGPKTYLEKPVEPDTYVRCVCDRLGVDADAAEKAQDEDKIRSQVERMVAGADPETLAQLLKTLKRKG